MLGSSKHVLQYDTIPMGVEFTETSDSLTTVDNEFLETLKGTPVILMVGTIEPRKGYLQALEAFQKLWQQGIAVQVVVVGQEGWLGVSIDQKRTMPQLMTTLKKMQDECPNLQWFNQASDSLLTALYQRADVLLVASEGEGFGLPIIEAAHYQLPVILRDIPVFREVAAEGGFYFQNTSNPGDLSQAIMAWLDLYKAEEHPSLKLKEEYRWQTSVQKVMQIIS
jgi:glycosyltransferase involved in cell wall biosynthesis